MTTDPYAHLDAAYLLGALAPEERAGFEAHLMGCEACRARVEDARSVLPYLIASEEDDLDALVPPLPDTTLPQLLARAARTSRRRRSTALALGAVAAAIVAVAVVLVSTRPGSAPPVEAMVVVRPSSVRATASVESTAWGTEITIDCGYDQGAVTPAGYRYDLTVRSRAGVTSQLGSWQLDDQRAITFRAGTALPIDQIQAIDITDADGTPLLALTPVVPDAG